MSYTGGGTIQVTFAFTQTSANNILFDDHDGGGASIGLYIQQLSNGTLIAGRGSNYVTSPVLSFGVHNATVTWDGTTSAGGIKFYLDGALIGSATSAYIGSVSTNYPTIGSYAVTNGYLVKGLVYEVRMWQYTRTQKEILKDLYKKLSGYEPGLFSLYCLDEPSGTIAYDYAIPTFTKSLIDCSGGVLNDKCKKVWTTSGGAMVTAAQSKFPQEGYSVYFDGIDDYITTSGSADLDFGSGDFTIDWWEYCISKPSIGASFVYGTGGTINAMTVGYNSGGANLVYMSTAGASWDLVNGLSLGTITNNQWVHLAITRQGNNFYGFKNGVLIDTKTGTGSVFVPVGNHNAYWGANSTYYFNGYINQPRFTKGKAIWTTNFTPPTAPQNMEWMW